MELWSHAFLLPLKAALLGTELGQSFPEGVRDGGIVFRAEEVGPEDISVEGGEAERGALGKGVGGQIGPGRVPLHLDYFIGLQIILNLMKREGRAKINHTVITNTTFKHKSPLGNLRSI
jgi:hypothetical protein